MGASKIVKKWEKEVMIVYVTKDQLFDLILDKGTLNGDNMINVFPNVSFSDSGESIIHEDGNIQITKGAVIDLWKEDLYIDSKIKLILK